MTLQEALDKCSICSLFNKDVSDEDKLQTIGKVMSARATKGSKAKLCNIIIWLLKKVTWQKQQIEKMKCCENCAWWYKLPNGQRDCAEICENRDNWSLRR